MLTSVSDELTLRVLSISETEKFIESSIHHQYLPLRVGFLGRVLGPCMRGRS